MDIHSHRALQWSNLYLRPKNSTSEELAVSKPTAEQRAHPTTEERCVQPTTAERRIQPTTAEERLQPTGPIINPAPEDELSPAIPDIEPCVSVINASSSHGEDHTAMQREDFYTQSASEDEEEVLLGSSNGSDPGVADD